jgi:hypothetical protein
MVPDWLWQVLGMMAGAASVYAAIRADLAALKVKAEMALTSASEAHQRIDAHLQRERG